MIFLAKRDIPKNLPSQMALSNNSLNTSPFLLEGGITELPQDLLEEILEFVDIDTALSLRSTCKSLRIATDSHRVWCAFVRQLQECPHISPPEEPLQDYTVDELRDWVTRRHGFKCVLKSLRTPTLRIRKLDTPSRITYIGMIPGGRWLLLGDIMGNLNMVDCEANTLELKPFIRDEYGQKDEMSILVPAPLDIWIDQAEPRLTFMIALQCSIGPTVKRFWETPSRLRLYRARLTGHGSTATLEAGSPLHEIWGAYHKGLGPSALNDRYFIQVGSTAYGKSMRVYHYSCCISPPPPLPIDVFLPHVAKSMLVLYILPGDRVALLTTSFFAIYGIPTSKENHNKTWMPLHLIKLPVEAPVTIGMVDVACPLYYGKLSTILTYRGMTAVMHVVIPNDVSEEPTITELVKNDQWFFSSRTVSGLTSTAVLLNARSFFLIHNSDAPREIMLGDEFVDTIKKTQEGLLDIERAENLQSYDETTGRIVALPSLREWSSLVLCDVYGRH